MRRRFRESKNPAVLSAGRFGLVSDLPISPGADLASAPGETAQSMAAKIAETSACSMAKSLNWWKCSAKTSSAEYLKDR